MCLQFVFLLFYLSIGNAMYYLYPEKFKYISKEKVEIGFNAYFHSWIQKIQGDKNTDNCQRHLIYMCPHFDMGLTNMGWLQSNKNRIIRCHEIKQLLKQYHS